MPALPLDEIGHDSTLRFSLRDGTCFFAAIKQVHTTDVVIAERDKSPQVILISAIVQVVQGDAIVFSSRSSWSDVVGTPVEFGESFIITLLNGQRIQGRPKSVDRDSITLRRSPVTSKLKKSEIATIDYVRLRPKSDNYLYQMREMSVLEVLDPRFYARTKLSPIRLFDAARTEDNIQLCSKP